MDKPKKWFDVYPYGSKQGDEEAKVFRALSRHAKFDWRSTGAIVKATGLSRERVEEIIDKYVNKVKPALIYAHPSNEDHWGYWERVPEVLKKDDRDVAKKDKDARVDKQIAGADMVLTWGSISVPATSMMDAYCTGDANLSDYYDDLPQECFESVSQHTSGDGNLDSFYVTSEELILDAMYDYSNVEV
jgi:hypothetical protein